MIYTAIAYRWGWTNGHWYPVYAGTDKTKALAIAQNETTDRAGKYGCAVLEFNDDGTEYERIAYFPSSYGEEKPYLNSRIEMFESLGHRMHEFASGKVWLPDGSGALKPTEVDPPQWVKDEVRRQEELAKMMDEFRAA